MKKPKYPARFFRLWLENVTDECGARLSKSEVARRLGCGRNQILDWEKNGAPYYIGLACQTLWEGKRDWKSPIGAPPRIIPKRPPPAKIELTNEQKLERLERIRWTKAQA